MTVSSPASFHPRVPGDRRVAGSDLLILRRARALIDELGADLDARLGDDIGESERLQLLRAATNRITRAANDAIAAYRRGQRSVTAALGRAGGEDAAALGMRQELQTARLELLRALDHAGRRYPWSVDGNELESEGPDIGNRPGD
jgi:hypothetical protein